MPWATGENIMIEKVIARIMNEINALQKLIYKIIFVAQGQGAVSLG